MPSPIGHALGSWIVGARPERGWAAQAVALAAIGIAPDLDLLWGRHSMETHSVGASLIVAFVLASAPRVRTILGARTFLGGFALISAVWFMHPLLDALGADDSPPRGVMLLWPFSREFFIAPFPVFEAISRMWWRDDVWTHNFVAVAKELAILGPVAIASVFFRKFLKKSGSGQSYPR